MENEKINGEQPMGDATSATNVGIDELSPASLEGSPLGKFKDVESLKTAYDNLQSEFTKKCQSLNELKKQLGDNAKAPQYLKDDWQQNVDTFISAHPEAKKYIKEIAEVLSSDKVVANSQNSLNLAYSVVLEKENKRLNDLINDENYLASNISPKMKEKIILQQLRSINYTQPNLLQSNGGASVVSSYKKPTTVKEAGEMAKKIFK